MSLQVWLPLNGNLNNQGVGTATVSGTATYTTSRSKVVPNSLNTSNQITINVPSIADKKICTFAFWAYVESASVTANWTLVARMNDKGTNSGSNMRFEVCPKSYNNGAYCFSNHNNANYGLTNGSITSPAGGYYDQWVHFCFTSDGKTFTRYMNGKKIGTCDYNGPAVFSGDFVLANNHLCLKQDVRIYDHCLSDKEIHELSKGLCLHYKLSRSCENLATSTATGSPSGFNDYTGKATVSRLDSDGNTIGKIYAINVPSDTATYSNYNLYVTFPRDTTKAVSQDGKKYTLSFKIKSSIALKNYQIYYEFNSASITTDIDTTWKTVSITGSATSQYSALYLIYGKTDRDMIKGGVLYIADIKLEYGSIATPWIPNPSDSIYAALGYNSTEPDCSGYGNDGTIKSTVTYSNDTPRYIGSIFIPSGGVLGSRKYPDNVESLTLSAWIKASNPTSQNIVGNWESGGCGIYTNSAKKSAFQYYDGSAYQTAVGTTVLSGDVWYFITGVFSYADKKAYIYVNGVLETQITVSTYIRIGGATNVPMSIGNPSATSVSGITNAYISDARVYATALSPEDILALYNAPTSIDSNGNMYCSEFVEV